VVIEGTSADPYEALIRAKELDLRLVMINGVARYGVPSLMRQLGSDGQSVSVGGRTRRLFLEQATADPDVAQVPLNEAAATLRQALQNIAELAKEIETPKPAPATRHLLDAHTAPVWSLALDEIGSCGVELCPRLPFNGPDDFTGPDRAPRALAIAAPPLSTILKPIQLDPLTVADDPGFLDRIAAQPNLPAAVRTGLAGLY